MKQPVIYATTFGSQLLASGQTRFRLWAPDCSTVEVVTGNDSDSDSAAWPMQRDSDGMFSAEIECAAGTPYRFRLDDGTLVPDPASRRQLDDVHGASVVCDPSSYQWRESAWCGRPWHEMVIYELHVGCCGGFDGVRQLLPHLVQLGVTAIELMPIADFSGTRNWGYDGVLPFAPARSYGSPDALKLLIDEAHGLGLCVYLDVVYNHFGPDGNYLARYASPFFAADRQSPWGSTIDFSQPLVRRFFIENALYWLQEFRFDGLRFDAVHHIHEADWLDEAAATIRATIDPQRHLHLVLENEKNEARYLQQGEAAHAYNAQWNDDAHNALHVLLTDEGDGYYRNFVDAPAQKLARALLEGFVYQGEFSPSQGVARGTPSGHLPAHAFVLFLQNHDQIGNRAFGERLTVLAHAQALRAATVLLLLSPQIPLLFMGEEWGSRAPFLFFTDFHGELAAAVREGRRNEFKAMGAFADPQRRAQIPDPNALETFIASSINRSDVVNPDPDAASTLAFYRVLLTLRRERLTPRLSGTRGDSARVLGSRAVAARWRLGDGSLLTIASNFDAHAVGYDDWSIAGALLFSSDNEDHRDQLPPYTTVVHLDDAPE